MRPETIAFWQNSSSQNLNPVLNSDIQLWLAGLCIGDSHEMARGYYSKAAHWGLCTIGSPPPTSLILRWLDLAILECMVAMPSTLGPEVLLPELTWTIT